MNKNTVLQLAPNVLKRMEFKIERFYLLNSDNDEIWTGNYATYLIVSKMDGIKTLEKIIKELQTVMKDYSFEEIFNSTNTITEELLEKGFLKICNK